MTDAKTRQEPRTWKQLHEEVALSPEEQRALDEAAANRDQHEAAATDTGPIPEREDAGEVGDVATDPDKLPSWAEGAMPDPKTGFRIPPGKRVFFVRLRREFTDAPAKGDRVLVCWTLTDGEENLAAKRSMGDSTRTYKEMTKQMIRAVDGVKTDWSGAVGPGNISKLWEEIGAVGRNLLVNVYHRTNAPTKEVILDFFINCFAARSQAVG